MLFGAMSPADAFSASETDSLKTHPDCSKRIQSLVDSLLTCSNSTSFLVNESDFSFLKKDFEIEVIEGLYTSNEYSKNLYWSLQLLQSGREEPFAIFSIARVLNSIFDRQKFHEMGKIVEKEDRAQAEDYRLLVRMLDRIRLDELAQITYQFCFRYKDKMVSYDGFTEEFKKSYQNLKSVNQ